MGPQITWTMTTYRRKLETVRMDMVRAQMAAERLVGIPPPRQLDEHEIVARVDNMQPADFVRLATRHGVELDIALGHDTVRSGGRTYDMLPVGFLATSIDIADGCEPLRIRLYKYPSKITWPGYTVRTHCAGWRGHGQCTTKNAMISRCGGPINFIAAHLTVCLVLDCYAASGGFTLTVDDSTGFYEHRDVGRLCEEVSLYGHRVPLTQDILYWVRDRFTAWGLEKVPELNPAMYPVGMPTNLFSVINTDKSPGPPYGPPPFPAPAGRAHRRIRVRQPDPGCGGQAGE